MKNECDRCEEYTFDSPGQLFSIYHVLLCRSCRNDAELWMRTQEFWDQYIKTEAALRLVALPKTALLPRLEQMIDLGFQWDAIKLTAFPLIEAWVKAGKTKEES